MRKHEISKVLNDIIIDALNDGYSIAFGELRGSYSNIEGQTVLAKGRDRLIIWASTSKDFRARDITVYAARIRLEVVGEGEYRRVESIDVRYNWPDDWMKGLFFQKTFYHVGEREDDWYVEDEAKAKAARDKHRERFCAYRFDSKELEVTPKLLKVVRKLKGFKTIKAENVRVTKKYDNWTEKYEYVVMNTKSGNALYLG